jgi:hypothetical protein
MTQTIINLGTGGALLNGRNGSTAGADSNDALFLDWPGDNAGNYVYLPGVAGNYLSVPDEDALDITGDIDIRARVAMDDWTPPANVRLVSKIEASGSFSYEFSLLTTGILRLNISTTGSDALLNDCTVATGISDGSVKWVRVTLDADNGVSGRDVEFFVSDDGVTWLQLGAKVTTAGAVTLHSGNARLGIGGRGNGVDSTMAGRFYRAQVLNGINGTTVLDVDTSAVGSGSATSFTAATGQTVTINRSTAGRKSVAVVSPVWLFGTDDFMQVLWSSLLGVDATDDATLVSITRRWTTGTDRGTIVSARRSNSTSNNVAAGYWMRQITGTNQLLFQVEDGTAGRNLGMPAGTDVAGRLDVFAGRINRSDNLVDSVINGTSVASNTINFGSLINPAQDTFRIGRPSLGATVAMDMELIGVAFFRRSLSDSELSQIVSYYQARLS